MALVLDSLMITGFVAAMMLLIECLNVYTRGRFSRRLGAAGPALYLFAALLGAIPGCLGAFTAVTLYSHGVISFGAVVAAMIASSGDEAFVMLALIPRTAVVLTLLLVAIAIAAGAAVDLIARRRMISWPRCEALVIHSEDQTMLVNPAGIRAQWRECSAARGILSVALLLLGASVAAGLIGPAGWDWVRVSLVTVSAAAFVVVAVVPDHFLEDHLWKHVARKHTPRVFFWTLGALALSGPVASLIDVSGSIQSSHWLLLLMACIVGLIPESGPHLIFVTLYAQGAIPFGVLLASSIVQDGHGMLPMLAHSRPAFAAVKAVNLLMGLAAGAAALAAGL